MVRAGHVVVLVLGALTAVTASAGSEAFPICAEPVDQPSPGVGGDFLVWQDRRNDDLTDTAIYGGYVPEPAAPATLAVSRVVVIRRRRGRHALL